MRMLYWGSLDWGSTSLMRFKGLESTVSHAYAVDNRAAFGDYLTRNNWIRLQLRMGLGPVISRASHQLLREVNRYKPDLLWIDQGVGINPMTLQKIKKNFNCYMVLYNPDSITASGFNRLCFYKTIREYDLCITSKSFDRGIYLQYGAKNVLLSFEGYDPMLHCPIKLTAEDKSIYSCDVGFAGDRQEDRARSLCVLIDRVPGKIHLYGRGWEKGRTGRRLAPHHRGWVSGLDYAKAICGAKICLGFLNRSVGDTFTTRSLEIPACGGFFLAERTEAHENFYLEHIEAEFFSSDEEMIDKIDYYLKNEDKRLKIALAGYEKVQKSGFRWKDRMEKCLEFIDRDGSLMECPGLQND